VAAALVAAGVDRSRITVRGRGPEQQLATPEASRRVEIRIG
jgi:outer membrane protein OmpA-like peptidoglycan-associated protein